ncbi:hypothetical protein EMPS_01343 [Entomortierella parvispora]|uniref:Uncharacterized protein n=1 Tax=Entomortierella parvispora TaxID=205924 RepID=A0A9P3H2S9_9FUNG|nr:hypothetical protein EMPS_01343 [Entomortierella parvispora]
MTNTQSKLALYQTLVPRKYITGLKLQLQRTLLIGLSLLKTHRRKAILLSLGPSTILKLITVILPIIKILPPTIKAIRALSYFSGGSSRNSGNNTTHAGGNSGINAGTGASGSMIDGFGLSMDELCEITWTPAEEMYWERVNAMVTRYGLCKTLGVTLAGVKPGRVEVIMPFRAEVSGEGGAFHASLLPTLVALTSQLTGLTLLPRHFTLKPIDFKCNILSDCDESTYLLVARGAVVVRGDHSITIKIEVLKASGLVPGSTKEVSPSANVGPSFFSWKSWVGNTSTTSTTVANNNNSNAADILVPGTGIESSQLIVCASGMQTSVIVRAGTDPLGEEEREMGRLRRERELRLRTSASSSSASLARVPSSASARHSHEDEEDAIVLGDSFQNVSLLSNLVRPLSSRPLSPTSPTPAVSATASMPVAAVAATRSLDSSVYDMVSPSTSSSILKESKESNDHLATASTTTSTLSYASAVRYGIEHEGHEHPVYEETSDTEAWQR